MKSTLVFDIETVPDVVGLRNIHGWSTDISDNEIVERAIALRRKSVENDFLPPYLQRIVVVGCAFRSENKLTIKALGNLNDPESVLIDTFFKTIGHYLPILVSWNGSNFDLPVLHYRSLIHNIQAPGYWNLGEKNRDFRFNNYIGRYHMRHIDLMDVLAKYNRSAYAPLNELSRLCGFPGKIGRMSGDKVWEVLKKGDIKSVRAYCETDVVNTWLLYCRFCFLRGELDKSSYNLELELVQSTLEAQSGNHWKEYLEEWSRKSALTGKN